MKITELRAEVPRPALKHVKIFEIQLEKNLENKTKSILVTSLRQSWETSQIKYGALDPKLAPKTLGKIGSYDVQVRRAGGTFMFAVYDAVQKNYAGFAFFSDHGKNMLVEDRTGFEPEYQGQGLAVKLYRVIITSTGKSICSDKMHTPGTLSIWKQLWKMPRIHVFGWDAGKKKAFQLDDDSFEDTDSDVYNVANQHTVLVAQLKNNR